MYLQLSCSHSSSSHQCYSSTAQTATCVENFRLAELLRHESIACSSLTQLKLCYGMRDVGMDYDRSIFGMKLSDCRSMARCLEYSETLVSLNLAGNLIDDDKLRMLASGLVNNLSVIHIDLSHNRIADRGVRAFAKLLHTSSVIQVVNLENNQACPNPFHAPALMVFVPDSCIRCTSASRRPSMIRFPRDLAAVLAPDTSDGGSCSDGAPVLQLSCSCADSQ